MAENDPGLGKRRNRPTPDDDFAAWIQQQAEALKTGRFDELDIEDLADEVESLARRDFKKLRSAIRVILLHMLKWDYQPEERGASWRRSINAARERVWGELASSPSFKPRIAEAIEQAFPLARLKAWEETGVFKLEHEPKTCPYPWDEIMHRPHELGPDRVPENWNDPAQGDISLEDD
jgi:Domain of unknown function DUF29